MSFILLNESQTDSLSNSTNFFDEEDCKTQKATVVWNTVLYLGLIVLSVGINLKVLCVLSALPRKRRKRTANVLIGHMSVVAILLTLHILLMVAEYADAVRILGKDTCVVIRFLKNTCIGVFSLNIVAIVYERFRLFTLNIGSLLNDRLLILIWLVAVVLNIPTFFNTEFIPVEQIKNNCSRNQHSTRVKGKCKAALLFGSIFLSVLLEIIRFMIFHLSVIFYMGYGLIKLRTTIASLYILKPIPNNKMRQRVQSLRFIFIHFFTFIIVWLPVGSLFFVNSVLKLTYKTESIEKFQSSSTFMYIMAAFFGVYAILNPLIFMLLLVDNGSLCTCMESITRNPDSTGTKGCTGCHRSRDEEHGTTQNEIPLEDINTTDKTQQQHHASQLLDSRFSTGCISPADSTIRDCDLSSMV